MKRTVSVWAAPAVSLIVAAALACGGPESAANPGSSTADAAACVSGPGGACGGNILGACTCAAGLTCTGSGGLPVGDVGGTCQPGACVDNVLCIQGTHWDSTACRCVPDRTCVDNVLCVRGSHWDPAACRCVPNRPGACTTAADCSGILPTLCMQCAGGTTGCAHWACVSGRCETAYCQ